MVCDILFSTAWNCGESDCQAKPWGGWHKANYWIDGRGYTVDNYSDGDHEKVYKRDLPKYEEVEASWRDYSEWVLENGLDPLGEFCVKRERKVTERWSIKVRRSIMGIALVGLRRGRKDVPFTPKASIPAHVAEYCNLRADRKYPVLYDFQTAEDLAEVGIKLNRWHAFTIERRIPRPDATIAAELRRSAKKHLGTATK